MKNEEEGNWTKYSPITYYNSLCPIYQQNFVVFLEFSTWLTIRRSVLQIKPSWNTSFSFSGLSQSSSSFWRRIYGSKKCYSSRNREIISARPLSFNCELKAFEISSRGVCCFLFQFLMEFSNYQRDGFFRFAERKRKKTTASTRSKISQCVSIVRLILMFSQVREKFVYYY